jgi:nucleotide-binding universal stress UspA family protein
MTEPAEAPLVTADPLAGDGRVVVGVDDSPQAAAALRWAIREAALRQATLEVVHAWQPPMTALPFGATLAIPVDEAEIDATARDRLDGLVDEALAGLKESHPDVAEPQVARTVVPGPAAMTLIDIALDADLLVVGSHGRTGLRQLVLGSVANACVQHAACPVVVIRLPST